MTDVCSQQTDCVSCVEVRDGFDACIWVIDQEQHFCYNWFDCANCYHDTVSLKEQCPVDSASTEYIIGVVIGVIIGICLCIGCVIFICRKSQRSKNSGNNSSNLPSPIPKAQPHPIPLKNNPNVNIHGQQKIVYVQVPQQIVSDDIPPAYANYDNEGNIESAALYASEGQIK